MAAPGERCPHCLRAFKRLRAHLPHCKAAPGTAANPEPNPRPGTATPGSGSGKARAAAASEGSEEPGSGQEASGGIRRQPGGQGAEPAVRDVSEWLDLSPEEVTGIPEQLRSGVRIVIRNHRARVLRDGSGSRSSRGSPTGRQKQSTHGSSVAGTDPARAEPREGTLGPETAKREPRGSGAAGAKGGKGRGKAPEVPPRGGPCRSSPRAPPRREGGDRAVAEQQLPGLGGGCDPSLPALHPTNLLPAAEPPRAHPEGTPESDPRGPPELRGGGKEAAAPPQPIPEGLALPQSLLQPSQSQSICPARARGLEWFPDLYPNYRGLRLFPGKLFQEDTRITVKALKGDSSRGQPGFLSAQHLLDVPLGELPACLATRDLSPQGLLGGAQRAWRSFSSKYLKVKRGGPAGVSMLLAGSCLLTSCWEYQASPLAQVPLRGWSSKEQPWISQLEAAQVLPALQLGRAQLRIPGRFFSSGGGCFAVTLL
ncbi:mitochondrial nucleoid-associated protein 1 [Heliangelus exortis]|uniref:mitochondrial nucleoid-associated protein 1 n=1 Tax=Heliangelus exortis TaxID=472823 RepID=UPI003A8F97D0